MSKDTIILIIIMTWTLIIYGGITFLIKKKRDYLLISGFYNRPDEEKEYLKQSGYLEKLGNLFLYTFYLLALAFLLTLFRVPFGAEIGFGSFLIVLLGGLIYLQKFEVPHKRKKLIWIFSSVSITVLLFLGFIFGYGYMTNDITITEDRFEVSGMYGVEWDIDEIEKVELLEELPEVLIRNNGMATTNLLKGKFRLEEPYGKGRLFIRKGKSPYLYVATKEDYVLINKDSKEEIETIYNQLLHNWKK